jgi:hypothetical protein
MQTYLVHSLNPVRFIREAGLWAFLGFQLLVGGMILCSLLHTVFVGSMVAQVIAEGPAGLVPADAWDWMSVAILAVGYGGAIVIVISGLIHLRAWHLIGVQLLLPLYWLLHSIAALLAAWQLINRPSYWAKTTHGVTRKARGGSVVTPVPVARPVRSRSG